METRKPLLGAGWRSAALALLALAIVACSHHNNNNTTVTNNMMNNTTAPQPAVDSFGAGFGTDFQANPNSQPANVSNTDVNPTDPTQQPNSVNNIAGN